MSSRWNYWINEPIFTDSGTTHITKRKHAMYWFCKEGLIPFLERAGYIFRYSPVELTNILLHLLFKMSEGKRVHSSCSPIDYYDDQYDLYNYTLDTHSWDAFWNKFEGLQDFQEDNFAFRIRYELREFVWSWLDIENSKTAQALHKELCEQEDYEESSKGKDDIYLQENTKRDYQDRHW
jgi:hypothetical protein